MSYDSGLYCNPCSLDSDIVDSHHGSAGQPSSGSCQVRNDSGSTCIVGKLGNMISPSLSPQNRPLLQITEGLFLSGLRDTLVDLIKEHFDWRCNPNYGHFAHFSVLPQLSRIVDTCRPALDRFLLLPGADRHRLDVCGCKVPIKPPSSFTVKTTLNLDVVFENSV